MQKTRLIIEQKIIFTANTTTKTNEQNERN